MLLYLAAKSQQDQTGPGLLPKIGFCREKQKLIDDFLVAVREISVLQKQQAQAAIDDDQDFSRFDMLLYFAQERKDAAKYAWIAHVEAHGC
jgi:hypothetical protein